MFQKKFKNLFISILVALVGYSLVSLPFSTNSCFNLGISIEPFQNHMSDVICPLGMSVHGDVMGYIQGLHSILLVLLLEVFVATIIFTVFKFLKDFKAKFVTRHIKFRFKPNIFLTEYFEFIFCGRLQPKIPSLVLL